jgi:4-hydroxy-tetrahydrodipicolinate reductase
VIKILVVGLPGNMATTFTRHALKEKNIDLINFSITGNDCDREYHKVDRHIFRLIKANDKAGIDKLFEEHEPIIVVDYTEPSVVEHNIDLYCQKCTNFVIGTTGVVIDKVSERIKESDINAVIAPNMGKQIVALQAMMKYAADNFPECFKDYTLEIRESHQKGKLDTSGTARAMVSYFEQLGIIFDENDIIKCREPKEQIKLGVPKKYLTGHGWHTYILKSADRTVHIEITHNVNGRDIYAKGTIDSIFFLNEKITNGIQGKVFSMIDVLKKS